MAGKKVLIATLPAVLLALQACSSAESDVRTRQIHAACVVAMGLNPSEAPYYTCINSLEKLRPAHLTGALSQRDARYAAPNDGSSGLHKSVQRTCFDIGYDFDDDAYGVCVVTLEQSLIDANMVGSR